MPVILFYVQHLWGVGHVYRATRIAYGLVNSGCQVHLVWGGTEIPGLDFTGMTVHHLKPVRTPFRGSVNSLSSLHEASSILPEMMPETNTPKAFRH